jgi:hypothetical protein
MEKRGSTYYLFYSGGDYRASYGMGYATASSPTGDSGFTKSPLNPILSETDAVLSPGGGSVTIGPDGGSWLLYHGRAGDYTRPRTLRLDPLFWSESSVFTPGPTTGPQTFQPEDTAPEPTNDPGPPAVETVAPSTNAPPVAPPVAPPADVLAPVLRLEGKWSGRARRRISVSARAMSEDLWLTVSCNVRVRGSRKGYALKGVTGSFIARSEGRTLTLRVSKKILRAIQPGLRRHRGVRARLTIEARDAAGNITVRKLAIDLTR